MSILLAVDGSSIFMRAFSVLPEDKRTVDDLEYLTVSMIRKAVRITNAEFLVVALDTFGECWRLNIHPGYKGKRTYSGLRPKQLTPMILPRLKSRGIATAYHRDMEADDVLCTLSNSIRKGHRMICYTRDSDLLALTHVEGVSLLWPEKGQLVEIDKEEAENRLGHPPHWHPMVRALTADTKDNMRAIFETPPKWRCPINHSRAVALLGYYKNISGVMKAAESHPELFTENEQQYLREFGIQIGTLHECAKLRVDVPLGVDARRAVVRNANLQVPKP